MLADVQFINHENSWN